MYHHFSCSIEGHCEANPHGEYDTLRRCKQECQPHPLSRDAADLTYQYAPGSARNLAPSDQVRVIKRITGLTVTRSQADRVLEALENLPTEGIRTVRESLLWPYLRGLFDPEEFEEALYEAGTFEAFEELQRTVARDQLDYKRVFLAALREGNCELARRIDDLPGSYIELADEDFQQLYSFHHLCVLEYLLDVYGNDYYNEHWFMTGAASMANVNEALLVLQLQDIDYEAVMDTAAEKGGINFMQQLAARGYYQALSHAAKYGAPSLFLALENYEEEPQPEEVYAGLANAQDQESVELLFSLLDEEYEPNVWTVAQGLRKGLDVLVASASDALVDEASQVVAPETPVME